MSTGVADKRGNESNSEFVNKIEKFQQDLPINRDGHKVFMKIDHNKVFMKIDLSTKNKVIDKLTEFNQEVFFDTSLRYEQMTTLLKENREIISTLNNLPVLVDSDEVPLDRGDIRSSGQSHADKFLKQLDILLNKVGKFDAKQDGIRTWFSKYEFYSGMLGWTDEQRVATLSFFLDSGLFRVAQSEETTSFNEIKNRLFKFVDDLLIVDWRLNNYTNIYQMVRQFNKFKFSKPEQRYWMNCIWQKESVEEYDENVVKFNDHQYERMMDQLLI